MSISKQEILLRLCEATLSSSNNARSMMHKERRDCMTEFDHLQEIAETIFDLGEEGAKDKLTVNAWLSDRRILDTPILEKEFPRIKNSAAPVTELSMTNRAHQCLRVSGIETLGQLGLRTRNDLRRIRNYGNKTEKDLLTALKEYNEPNRI